MKRNDENIIEAFLSLQNKHQIHIINEFIESGETYKIRFIAMGIGDRLWKLPTPVFRRIAVALSDKTMDNLIRRSGIDMPAEKINTLIDVNHHYAASLCKNIDERGVLRILINSFFLISKIKNLLANGTLTKKVIQLLVQKLEGSPLVLLDRLLTIKTQIEKLAEDKSQVGVFTAVEREIDTQIKKFHSNETHE